MQGLMGCIRDNVYSALLGDDWIGIRVRSSSHRAVDGTGRELQGVFASVGTIVAYCPSTFEHLVVFDEEHLQPRWLVCQKSTVEVLLGAERADMQSCSTDSVPSIESSAVTRFQRSVVDSKDSICFLCKGCDVHSIKNKVHGSLKQCFKCNLRSHSYCIPNLTYSPSSSTPIYQHNSNNPAVDLHSSQSQMWACWNCTGKH